MSDHTADIAAALEQWFAAAGSALVAFSGGVDSSVVATAAARSLGPRVLAVTAKSESNTGEDLALCEELATAHGLQWRVLEYSELAIPNYAANPANRCFYCKDALYSQLTTLAAAGDIALVADGTNLDDGGDYRPGLRAVEAHGVRSPLRELGIRKDGVRALARHYGLSNHDRPAAPCLSSRIPYGEAITRDKLERIAAAEAYLRGLGLRELRVRHHEKLARIEIPAALLATVLPHREGIVARLRELGFAWVTLDLEGFRSGGLNRVLESGPGTAEATPRDTH